jgi:hypothetical protein
MVTTQTLGLLFLMAFPFLTVSVELFAIFSCCLHFGKFVPCCVTSHHHSLSPLPSPRPHNRPRTLTKDSLSRYFQTGYGEKLVVWFGELERN